MLALFLLVIFAGHALAGLQPCEFHNPVERDGDTALLLQCVASPETIHDELLLTLQKPGPRHGRCRLERGEGIFGIVLSWVKARLMSTWAFIRTQLIAFFYPPACTDIVVRQSGDLLRQNTELMQIIPPGYLQKIGDRSLVLQHLELIDPKMRVIWLETRRYVKLMQMMM